MFSSFSNKLVWLWTTTKSVKHLNILFSPENASTAWVDGFFVFILGRKFVIMPDFAHFLIEIVHLSERPFLLTVAYFVCVGKTHRQWNLCEESRTHRQIILFSSFSASGVLKISLFTLRFSTLLHNDFFSASGSLWEMPDSNPGRNYFSRVVFVCFTL